MGITRYRSHTISGYYDLRKYQRKPRPRRMDLVTIADIYELMAGPPDSSPSLPNRSNSTTPPRLLKKSSSAIDLRSVPTREPTPQSQSDSQTFYSATEEITTSQFEVSSNRVDIHIQTIEDEERRYDLTMTKDDESYHLVLSVISDGHEEALIAICRPTLLKAIIAFYQDEFHTKKKIKMLGSITNKLIEMEGVVTAIV